MHGIAQHFMPFSHALHLTPARSQHEAHWLDHNLRGIARGPVQSLACPLGKSGCLFKSSRAEAVRRHMEYGVLAAKTDTPLVTLLVSCSICPFWTIKCPCCGDDVGKAQWPDHAARSCANRGRRIALVSMLPLAQAVLATEASEI